ncbi:M28 family peptidase [Bacteroidota bacterium]
MKKRTQTIFLLLLSLSLSAFTQIDPIQKGIDAVSPAAIKAQLDFLASDVMMGRNTGEKGGFTAAEYIASIMATYGVAPGGDIKTLREEPTASWRDRKREKYRSYYQDFSLIKYRPGKEQHLEILTDGVAGEKVILSHGTDYKVGIRTAGAAFTAPLVFIGYGINDSVSGWNDFNKVDLAGKIVVRCYGYPGRGDSLSKGYEAFNSRIKDWQTSPLSNRNDWIEGALAVIDIPEGRDPLERWSVNDPDQQPPDWYEGDKEYVWDGWRMELASDSIGRGPIRITLSKRAWNLLSDGLKIDLEGYKKAAAEMKTTRAQALNGKQISLLTTTESEVITARNVVGYIAGVDTTRYIVVGAHYDHMGSWEGYVFNGADDNASGTVGVLATAGACMATGQKPPVTIVFAAWTGEEKGLLGSEYFVENPFLPLAQTMLNINYDMISRNTSTDTLKNECSISFSKDRTELKKISKANIERYKIDLNVRFRASTGQWGGSDYVPFGRKGVPFIANMAAFHTEYHTPTDDSWKCDTEKMARIVRLNFATLWELAGQEEEK